MRLCEATKYGTKPGGCAKRQSRGGSRAVARSHKVREKTWLLFGTTRVQEKPAKYSWMLPRALIHTLIPRHVNGTMASAAIEKLELIPSSILYSEHILQYQVPDGIELDQALADVISYKTRAFDRAPIRVVRTTEGLRQWL